MCLLSNCPLAFLKPHVMHTRMEIVRRGFQMQQEALRLDIRELPRPKHFVFNEIIMLLC